MIEGSCLELLRTKNSSTGAGAIHSIHMLHPKNALPNKTASEARLNALPSVLYLTSKTPALAGVYVTIVCNSLMR